MPSRAKRWFVADETDREKIFRYENEETPEIWLEIQLDNQPSTTRASAAPTTPPANGMG
jgi:hypothetical protein